MKTFALLGILLGSIMLAACGGGPENSNLTPQTRSHPVQRHGHHGTAGQVTLYTLPTTSADGIATGPDGALWAAEIPLQGCPNNGSLAQITTSGTVTEHPVGNCDLFSLITGPDGALWISDAGGEGYPLNRFKTGSGGFNEFGTDQPTIGFYGLTVGSDGAIWISAGNEIVRSDTGGVMINYTVPDQDAGAYYISAGPDGALWFTDAGPDTIGRVTTTGTFADYPIPTSGSLPAGITAGPDGAMWFAEHNADKVGRIDMNGNITEFPLPPGSGPYGIAAGADGNLWIAENTSNAVASITTSGVVTEYSMPPSCSYSCSPFQITAGPDGAMWFTLLSCPSNCYPSSPGLVGRITTDGSLKRRIHKQHDSKPSPLAPRNTSLLKIAGIAP